MHKGSPNGHFFWVKNCGGDPHSIKNFLLKRVYITINWKHLEANQAKNLIPGMHLEAQIALKMGWAWKMMITWS
jgi:hypothetical protein